MREKPRRSGESGCDDEVDADDRWAGGGAGPRGGARGRRLRRQRRRDQRRHSARAPASRSRSTFWHGQTQGAAELLQQMIDDFNKHPSRHRRLQGLRRRQLRPDAAEGHRRPAGRQLSRHRLHLRLRPRQPRQRRRSSLDLTDAIDAGDIDWDRFDDAAGQAVDRRRSSPRGAGVHRQPRRRLQQEHLRRGRDGLPDRRLVVGRLHARRPPSSTTRTPGSSASAGRAPATRTRPGGSGRWSGSRAATSSARTARASASTAPAGEQALDVVATGGRRRVRLHRQHRRQRAHAAAVRQRQDGDEHRRPVLAARVRRRRGRLRGRLAALVQRRAHDDRRPRYLGGVRQRRRCARRRRSSS